MIIRRYLIISVIIGLLIVALEACRYRVGHKSSSSIKYAKDVGTYICEYNPKNIIINDSIEFEIKNVFAEKRYRQLNNDRFFIDYTIDSTKSQIVLVTEPGWGELWREYGYSETWTFSNMRSVRKYTWVIDIDAPIPPDTVYVEVIRRHIDSTGGAGIHYGEKIGEFFIVKKVDGK